MLIPFVAAAASYGAASFAYGATGALDEPDPPPRAPRVLLSLAALLHFSTIGAQCMVGQHPLASIFNMVSLALLVAIVAFLAVSGRRRPMPALGSVLAPVALIALALSVVTSSGSDAGAIGGDGQALLWAHIGLAAGGLAGAVLAAGIAGLYLAKDHRLRSKQPAKAGRSGRGMSLSGLERLHWWVVLAMTPVFTGAVITGALIATRAEGASLLSDRWLELAASGLAWATCVAVLVSRLAWGLRGRRAAWLSLLGFLALLLVIASYALRA